MKHLGPHVSASGGVENAPLNAMQVGATAFALFTKNQRQWFSAPLTDTSVAAFKENLAKFDPEIAKIEAKYGPNRAGDIPHSLACIDKAKNLLGYAPEFSVKRGLQAAGKWYFENLKF